MLTSHRLVFFGSKPQICRMSRSGDFAACITGYGRETPFRLVLSLVPILVFS